MASTLTAHELAQSPGVYVGAVAPEPDASHVQRAMLHAERELARLRALLPASMTEEQRRGVARGVAAVADGIRQAALAAGFEAG